MITSLETFICNSSLNKVIFYPPPAPKQKDTLDFSLQNTIVKETLFGDVGKNPVTVLSL